MEGIDYRTLLTMRQQGQGWLADILEGMLEGELEQVLNPEAEAARQILEGYRQNEIRAV